MRQILFLIFAILVLMQPNAQTRDASNWITAAQFGTLVLVVLTRDRPK